MSRNRTSENIPECEVTSTEGNLCLKRKKELSIIPSLRVIEVVESNGGKKREIVEQDRVFTQFKRKR